MKSLGLLCPGKNDPQHKCHDVVKGRAPGIPSVSKFAGLYPPQFVQAVLDTVPVFRDAPAICLLEDDSTPGCCHDVCPVGRLSKNEILPVLKRLHQNLGHPPIMTWCECFDMDKP